MDSKRNNSEEKKEKIGKTAEFESRLAKIILENPSIYQDTVNKVNNTLINFFKDQNKYNFQYDHPEKKIYTMTNLEFLQHVYKHEPQDYVLDFRLKEVVENPNRLLTDFSKSDPTLLLHFWKLFFDDVFKHMPNAKFNAVEIGEKKEAKATDNFSVPSLKELTQILLASTPEAASALLAVLRSPELFEKKRRGRIQVKPDELTTRDLGISPKNQTPDDLRNHFSSPIHAAKLQFVPDTSSEIVSNMERLDRPFIAGPSGTMSYFILAVSRLLVLNEEEVRDLNTFLAGVMVSEGNHSIYEIALIAREAQLWKHKDEYLYSTFLTPKLFELSETLDLLDKFKNFKDICLTKPEELEENPMLRARLMR